MFEFLALVAFCLAVPLLALLVVVKLDTPGEDAGQTAGDMVGPTGWPFLDGLLARLRFWPAVGVCVFSFLVFAAFASHTPEIPFFVALALVFLLFLRAWRHEFVVLMACPDDSFPGRSDKLVWAALMVLLPPVGFTCRRAYRRAQRLAAEPEAQTHAAPHAKAAASPAADWI